MNIPSAVAFVLRLSLSAHAQAQEECKEEDERSRGLASEEAPRRSPIDG